MRAGIRRSAGWLCACAVAAVLQPAAARDSAPPHLVSFQAGWWSVEAEYRAPFGLFVDVGLPWFAMVLDDDASGMESDGALGIKLGYEYPLSEHWSLRGGLRAAFSFSHGCPCLECAEEHEIKSFGFLEADILYRHPSGLLIGVSMPLHAFDDVHSLFGDSPRVEHFFFPMSLAFTQIYVGYFLSF